MMPDISACTSSAVRKPSRWLSASASSSEALKSARAASTRGSPRPRPRRRHPDSGLGRKAPPVPAAGSRCRRLAVSAWKKDPVGGGDRRPKGTPLMMGLAQRPFSGAIAVGVAFRIGPECISICVNDFTRPHWCGNHTIAPEKCGIGPENSDSMWRSAWVRSGHRRRRCAWRTPGEEAGTATLPDASGRDGTGCTRPPVAPNRCRASCWRSGLLPCVRSNFPEQSGLFPEQ